MTFSSFDYQRFFELSPDLLCIAGYDGYFKKINPSVSKLLGYTTDELYAMPINTFIHPDDVEQTSRVRKNIHQSNTLYYFENRYVTKNGDVVWLAWTALPVDKDQLVFAIAKNITHKKKLEEERVALVEHLTAVNNELRELSLSTSHDLRTPLSGLLHVVGLLDHAKLSDAESVEMIDLLRLTSDSLRNTVNNYVDVLSKTNGFEEASEVVHFEEVFQESLKSLVSVIRSTKAEITTDFSAVKSVPFKKAYMESIFLNLISNAIKYCGPGVIPQISIRSGRLEGATVLVFSDNGIGFDMERVRDKIFGLHQTFHNNFDSKGVGLYLVHNQIVRLGGKIAVDSEVNRGTTFTITFRKDEPEKPH